MDAREQDPDSKFYRRLSRIVAAWLATLMAVGLWQGYGAWLLGKAGGDAG